MKPIIDLAFPYLELIFKILLAVILTGVVGYNREKKGMTVGIRTHVLVGLSAVVLQVISLESAAKYSYQGDIFRLGGQMVSGIGFLGAGAIIKEHRNIRGLTTASSVFFVACIGLAVGAGIYIPAVFATLAAYAFLIDIFGLKKIVLSKNSKHVTIGIELNGIYKDSSKDIIHILDDLAIDINSIKVTTITMEKSKVILKLSTDEETDINDILGNLIEVNAVVKAEVISKKITV